WAPAPGPLLPPPPPHAPQPIDLVVGDGRVDQDRVAFAGDERTARRRPHRPDPGGGVGRGWPRVKPQRPGLDRSASAQPASAFLMKDATATGWAMNAVCEPPIYSVAAPIRSAMNRSASGGMALSWSDTRHQDGLVFHPAAVASSV